MFKTLKHIKKKILAAAMATAILVSGNFGTSSVISGNHSITGTAATVSAKTIIYLCTECDRTFKNEKKYYEHMASVHKADTCPYCGYATRNRTALESHKKSCQWKNQRYNKACPFNYKDVLYNCDKTGCKLDTWKSPDEYEKHLETCPYRNHCPLCDKSFWDYGKGQEDLINTIKSHITYDCKMNPDRQVEPCEALTRLGNAGFDPPIWNVKEQRWECPYCDDLSIFASSSMTHIYVHTQEVQLDKKYGQYF